MDNIYLYVMFFGRLLSMYYYRGPTNNGSSWIRGIFSLFDVFYPDVQQTCFCIPKANCTWSLFLRIQMNLWKIAWIQLYILYYCNWSETMAGEMEVCNSSTIIRGDKIVKIGDIRILKNDSSFFVFSRGLFMFTCLIG